MADSLSRSSSIIGWDMVIQICTQGMHKKGVTVSPLSVSIALAMLAGGASADRRRELCSKLGINRPEELNTIFANLLHTFGTASDSETLTIANPVFADQTFTMYPNYAEHVQDFRAYIKTDFLSLPEGTEDINAWIEDKTKGMIKDMLTRAMLKDAHVILVNALAFKGTWQTAFDPKNTRENYPFQVAEGKTRTTSMMFLLGQNVECYDGAGYTAIRLPYTAPSSSSQMSFLAYLPNSTNSLEETLPQIRNESIPIRFSRKKFAELGFPKLKIETGLEIFDMLRQLDYPLSGNFPDMGEGPNQVQSIIHHAAIDLDEHGTKAAAATVIAMRRGLPLTPPQRLIFDRPFAFSIVANATNLVLFTGVFTEKSMKIFKSDMNVRFQGLAIGAVHEAAAAYLVKNFERANLLTIHGGQATLQQRDMMVVQQLKARVNGKDLCTSR